MPSLFKSLGALLWANSAFASPIRAYSDELQDYSPADESSGTVASASPDSAPNYSAADAFAMSTTEFTVAPTPTFPAALSTLLTSDLAPGGQEDQGSQPDETAEPLPAYEAETSPSESPAEEAPVYTSIAPSASYETELPQIVTASAPPGPDSTAVHSAHDESVPSASSESLPSSPLSITQSKHDVAVPSAPPVAMPAYPANSTTTPGLVHSIGQPVPGYSYDSTTIEYVTLKVPGPAAPASTTGAVPVAMPAYPANTTTTSGLVHSTGQPVSGYSYDSTIIEYVTVKAPGPAASASTTDAAPGAHVPGPSSAEPPASTPPAAYDGGKSSATVDETPAMAPNNDDQGKSTVDESLPKSAMPTPYGDSSPPSSSWDGPAGAQSDAHASQPHPSFSGVEQGAPSYERGAATATTSPASSSTTSRPVIKITPVDDNITTVYVTVAQTTVTAKPTACV